MNPNPNKETPEQEPSEGNALGIALRVLYVHAYVQGFNDHKNGIKMDSNHNKDERVATAYDTIATHYKAREADLEAAKREAAKAYGGCTNCYGKGWSSYATAHSGRDTDQDIGSPGGRYYKKVNEPVFCKCGRGKQLKQMVEAAKREAEHRGRLLENEVTYNAIDSLITKGVGNGANIMRSLASRRRELEYHLSPNKKESGV